MAKHEDAPAESPPGAGTEAAHGGPPSRLRREETPVLRWKGMVVASLIVVTVAAAHVATFRPGEPFFNNDESRHVMTGVFFRDFFRDLPASDPQSYAIRYYLQYPALGLLTWPPLFHATLGLSMLAFGMSFLVAKALVGLFAAAACIYLYLLAARTHDGPRAAVAALIFGFSPLVFSFSRQIMLEIPTLAFCLAATYHCSLYIDSRRRRDLGLAALATALAILTRFDGFYLLPLFLMMLWARGRLDLLARRETWLALLLTLALVTPTYVLIIKHVGGSHGQAITRGTDPTSTSPFALENFLFYPAHLAEQMGWFALAPALVGGLLGMRSGRRLGSSTYYAMMAATYLMIVSVAELECRHAIYWSPALAVFAADGIAIVSQWLGGLGLHAFLAASAVAGTCLTSCGIPTPYLVGYEAAARYVVAQTQQTPVCLFDSYLNGDFIYQIRRHDPGRRFWLLRGDKLFYSVLSDPHAAYQEYARGEDDVLAGIFKYAPELIVVEEPQVQYRLPMGEVLRAALRNHPERFRLEARIPVESNNGNFRGVTLAIYRNLLPNANRERSLELNMLALGRSIRAEMAP